MENKTNGMAVASMVLGIVGLVFSILYWPIGFICGVVGVCLSVASKKSGPSGMATAGLVCGILAIVFSLMIVVACASIASRF